MRFDKAVAIHVGTPSPEFTNWTSSEKTTKRICFHGFASLSTERGKSVESPEFNGLGNQWCLKLCPGGDASSAEGMVSVDLYNNSNKAIEIDFGFSVNDGNGNLVAYKRTTTPNNFDPMDDADGSNWGYEHFAKRSKLLNSLVDGALVIQVHMKVVSPPPFLPENPSACKIIQGLFMNDKSADIVFEVGGEEKSKDNAMTLAKTEPVLFPAHRCIVENCSIIFAELCESNGEDKTTPISISGVSPDVFRLLLLYMYGGKVSDDNMTTHAKEIIDAADRYGVSSLKLEAEASIVEDTNITMDNVMELLLYSDSKNCALLKEAAMDFLVENKADVIEELSFTDIPGTLIRDVLATVLRGEKEDGIVGGSGGNHFSSMRVSELRKRAHEKGLDVDGSREMLIAALKKVFESESVVDEGGEESDEEPEDL